MTEEKKIIQIISLAGRLVALDSAGQLWLMLDDLRLLDSIGLHMAEKMQWVRLALPTLPTEPT